jgi:large subunit ribosomal protein L24
MRKAKIRPGSSKSPQQYFARWNIGIGDFVEIIAGDDKGKRGKVTQIMKDRNELLIEGLHKNIRFQRPTIEQRGQLVPQESPLHVSNVQLIDPETNKPTRIRIRYLQDGSRVRVGASGSVIARPSRPKPSGSANAQQKPHPYVTPLDLAQQQSSNL